MPEQKLNPKALKSLYKALIRCLSIVETYCMHGSIARELRFAIALAESPAEQPPSGMTPRQARNHAFVWPEPPVPPSDAMTIERAMEIAKCYACLGLDALTSLGPADLAAEFIRIDRAVRIKTLEWIRDHVLINDRADDGPMHVAIKRRLTEIRKEHR